VLIIPSSWGSQLGGYLHAIKQFFWRRCWGERGFLQGESLASNHFTLLLFCFTLFLLVSFYRKYKKLVPFIVDFSLLLLLVHYVVSQVRSGGPFNR
jgi:hypothetical protein